jgi:hypothetical protein
MPRKPINGFVYRTDNVYNFVSFFDEKSTAYTKSLPKNINNGEQLSESSIILAFRDEYDKVEYCTIVNLHNAHDKPIILKRVKVDDIVTIAYTAAIQYCRN